jgi:hypothetical protein
MGFPVNGKERNNPSWIHRNPKLLGVTIKGACLKKGILFQPI